MVDGRKLLTRDQFRDGVFARDRNCCVICKEPGVDAHHIIERKLFNDGGYYLDNGATLCAEDHVRAETTELSVQAILKAAGIDKPVYPGHIPADEVIDKWGNQIMPNGSRMRGEMFEEEQVQKVLASAHLLDLFSDWRKYPRTEHFDWSQGVNSDDKVLKSTSMLAGRRIIGTIKMDGENTTLYREHMHARSLDSKHNYTRDEVKAFWSGIKHEIPDQWRICGENMWAVHSIEYTDLMHVFYGFSVWDETNTALPWDAPGQFNTLEIFDMLQIQPVDTVYDGVFDAAAMKRIGEEVIASGQEGVVFRVADAIPYRDFGKSVGKVVRKNHVTTDQHWMHGEIRRNGFRKPGAVPFISPAP